MESKVERYVENYVVNKNTMALLPVILSEKKIVTRVVEVQDSFFRISKAFRYYRKKLPQAWF